MKMFRVVVNGNEYKVGIEEIPDEISTQQAQVPQTPSTVPMTPKARPKTVQRIVPKPTELTEETDTAGNTVTAPMPGTIISVEVSTGTVVSTGQTLLILEAMKMENEIKAPCDGIIREVNVSPGTSVNVGDVLVVLAP